jgi:sarcosine oxidase subunit gamma
MAERRFHSALQHRADRAGAKGLSIALKEMDDRGMIDVRGLPTDAGFLPAVKDVLGFDLPMDPRTSRSRGEISALWLSTDQWLIILPRETAPDFHARLVKSLAGIHSLVVDVSDARAIVRLEGDTVRETMNKGTSADFTDSGMKAGTVRRLLYAQVAALAHVVSTDPDVIDLYVFRSYADHAWSFLLATAREGARVKLFGKQG